MVYEERLSSMDRNAKEYPPKPVVSQEIQTDTQVTEANSPGVDVSISEQDVAERIHQEKEKLGEMMEDLRLRILELEESRKLRDEEEKLDEEQRQGTPSMADLDEAIEVTSDSIRHLEEKLLGTTQLVNGTQTEESFLDRVDSDVQTDIIHVEEPEKDGNGFKETKERMAMLEMMESLKERIRELESNLKAKDELIHGFKIIRPTHPQDDDHTSIFSELQEALEV